MTFKISCISRGGLPNKRPVPLSIASQTGNGEPSANVAECVAPSPSPFTGGKSTDNSGMLIVKVPTDG